MKTPIYSSDNIEIYLITDHSLLIVEYDSINASKKITTISF